jgi:hypothetical protein
VALPSSGENVSGRGHGESAEFDKFADGMAVPAS